MPFYKVTVVLESAGNSSITFKEPVMIDDITLRTDVSDQNHRPKIYAEFEFKSEDEPSQIKNYAYSEIEKKVLPIIIFLSKSPYRIRDINIEPLSEIREEDNIIKINAIVPIQIGSRGHISIVFEDPSAEVLSLLERLNRIDPDSESVLVRAIKYWNRAMSDPDPIDRFINLYIALEILAGELVKEEYENNKWVSALYDKFGLNGVYGGYKIHHIRAALLHYKNEHLSKDEAERIVKEHVNEFSQEVFKLIKIYFDQKASGGSIDVYRR